MSILVKADHLSKSYGSHQVVKDLSLDLKKGEILGLLGPNGAGKTTTMRLITGFLMNDHGHVTIAGHDLKKEPLESRSKIGYLPEGAPLYPDMTPRMILNFAAEAHNLSLSRTKKRIKELTKLMHLEYVMDQAIETLSKGFKRRVAMAMSIIHDPDVLIMDEPTDGLDPNQKREVRDLIQLMAKDKAIVISTHILEEVVTMCTRVMIIDDAQIKIDTSIKDLLSRGDLEKTFYELTKGKVT